MNDASRVRLLAGAVEPGASAWLLTGVALFTSVAVGAAVVGAPGVGLALLVLTFLGVACAAAIPGWGGFVQALTRVVTAEPVVALTFDDGPDPQTTPQVLAALAAAGARATFFVIGEKAARHPQLLAAIVRGGHEVGVHGHRHDWRAVLGPTAALEELHTCAAALHAAGLGPVRWARPAYGVTTPAYGSAVRRLGLRVVGWSQRAFDTSPAAAGPRLSRLARRLRRGDIVLLHDAPERQGRPIPAAVAGLSSILAALASHGLRSITLSELVATHVQGVTAVAPVGSDAASR